MAEVYDALLVVSFGGPEGPDDVIPFLENVLRGRNVPRERMLEVAEHYQHFGGISPINAQNRALIAALQTSLDQHGPQLPIYWGNRNWHPFLADALSEMARDGIKRCLAFVTSAFSSYSGCRQYREDIHRVREQVGPEAPEVHKLRAFFNHPGFIQAVAARIREAEQAIPSEHGLNTPLIFTAHSIPTVMAESCRYEMQLREACRLVADEVGNPRWQLAFQSRSGPPQQPWLEPDIGVVLNEWADQVVPSVIVEPIGFISDHMEVLFDLDVEAKELCDQRGLNLVRAGTVGTHPDFVEMIRQLIRERTDERPRESLGELGTLPDFCPPDCCPAPLWPGRPAD